jgi:hypothetical protein
MKKDMFLLTSEVNLGISLCSVCPKAARLCILEPNPLEEKCFVL